LEDELPKLETERLKAKADGIRQKQNTEQFFNLPKQTGKPTQLNIFEL